MKVIGYEPLVGEYEGHHYEKFKIFCMQPITREGGKGFHVDVVKVKQSAMPEIIERLGLQRIEDLINKEVEVLYNKYGQPISFIASGD